MPRRSARCGWTPISTLTCFATYGCLKLAEDEAEVIGDPTALGVRELLITQGSRGSTVYWGGRSEFVRAHPIVADPTGAGDAFSVAYVVARNAGFAPPGAARRATAVVAAMLAAR